MDHIGHKPGSAPNFLFADYPSYAVLLMQDHDTKRVYHRRPAPKPAPTMASNPAKLLPF